MQLFSSAGAESSSPSLPVPLHPTLGQGGLTSRPPPPAVAGQLSHEPKNENTKINIKLLAVYAHYVTQVLSLIFSSSCNLKISFVNVKRGVGLWRWREKQCIMPPSI